MTLKYNDTEILKPGFKFHFWSIYQRKETLNSEQKSKMRSFYSVASGWQQQSAIQLFLRCPIASYLNLGFSLFALYENQAAADFF